MEIKKFETFDELKKYYEPILGKTGCAIAFLGYRKVLVCGTPLAFDDYIEAVVADTLLHFGLTVDCESSFVKDIAENLMVDIENSTNTTVIYLSKEY